MLKKKKKISREIEKKGVRTSICKLGVTVRSRVRTMGCVGFRVVCLKCTSLHMFHALLGRPRVVSHALGCGVRRGPARTPRRKCGSRPGSVARALGVQSRAIWKVIAGSLSAEPEPTRPIETKKYRSFHLSVAVYEIPEAVKGKAATVQQPCFNIFPWWQPRTVLLRVFVSVRACVL